MKHFFDIGANTGQTFDCVPLIGDSFDNATIWCFEPSPRSIGPLRERCQQEAAGKHGFRINLCPFGLWSHNGFKPIYEHPDDSKCDSFLEPNLIEYDLVIPCPVFDIYNFIRDNIHAGDQLTIKIDAEGSELPILSRIMDCRSLWPYIDSLLVEWHFNRPNFPDSIKAAKLKQRVQNSPIPLHDWIY